MLQPGTVFDSRYEIVSVLGRGGFATVYLARELGVGRAVALKIVHAGADAIGPRLQREIQAVGQLQHPHIVQLYTHGQGPNGELYLVFEHVAGEDLSALLARVGRLPPPIVRHILMQLLQALDAAHRAGLVHRDLKPDNVRIFEWGGDPHYVKLLDFGIVRPTETGSPSLTKTGELIGTPRYMSPEQLTGKPLTPASDIYSLGLLSFELLAGRDALHGYALGEQLERLLAGHTLDDAAATRADPQLMGVIRRMTLLDPVHRLASARAVLDALEPPVRGSAAPDPGGPEPSRRGRYAIAGLVAAAAAAVAIFGRTAPDDAARVATPRVDARKTDLIRARGGANIAGDAAVRAGAGTSGPQGSGAVPDAGEDAGAAELGPWASEGCGRAGRARDDVYVPISSTTSTPHRLIILLHSDLQDPGVLMREMGVDRLADRERLVVLHPAGTNPTEGWTTWRDGSEQAEVLRGAVHQTLKSHCIDRRYVYVLAQGDGGRVAHRLACEPWVTATVVHGHAFRRLPQECEHPGPLLWVHAMKSIHLPLDGSPAPCSDKTKVHPDDVDEKWRATRGCDANPVTWYEGAGGTCLSWGCDVAPYVSCRVDGGREWPGTTQSFLRGQIPGIEGLNLSSFSRCPVDKSHDLPMLEQAWRFLSSAPAIDVDLGD